MPDSLPALLVLVFAIIPGAPGETVYRIWVGVDPDEKAIWPVLRLIFFSVVGLALYVSAGSYFDWPPPIHIRPERLAALDAADVGQVAVPFWGQFLGGLLAGVGAVLGMLLLGKLTPHAPYPAWETFVIDLVPQHWVAVGLTNGDSYAGALLASNKNVESKKRDLVLKEPAKYSGGRYVAQPFTHMYVPASQVQSIAILPGANEPPRIGVAPGDTLFGPEP